MRHGREPLNEVHRNTGIQWCCQPNKIGPEVYTELELSELSSMHIYNFNICFTESWSSKDVFQELEALKQQVIGRHEEKRPREKLKCLQGNLHTFKSSKV